MMWPALAVIVLALPRFFLIPIGDSGIRAEDLVLLFLAPAAWLLMRKEKLQMRKCFLVFGIYYGIVAISAFVSSALGRMPLLITLAFGMRPMLYVGAFVIGFNIRMYDKWMRPGLVTLFGYALIAHLVYGLGAAIGWFPNVSSFDPSRLSGLSNGPYELSAMLCMFSVLFLWRSSMAMVVLGIVGLIWTQSRIALISFMVYLFFMNTKAKKTQRWMFMSIVALLVVGVLSARSTDGELGDTFSTILDLSSSFSAVAGTQADYFDAAYSDSANSAISSNEGDPSLLLRVARWSMVAATALDNPINLLLGMGPGYYSVALDGNYMRLIGETGIIGLIAYIYLLFSVRSSLVQQESRKLIWAIIVQLLVVAVFIDIFVSLKVMSLFWMIVGALKREEYIQNENRNLSKI